jgi:hypothetical protein
MDIRQRVSWLWVWKWRNLLSRTILRRGRKASTTTRGRKRKKVRRGKWTRRRVD